MRKCHQTWPDLLSDVTYQTTVKFWCQCDKDYGKCFFPFSFFWKKKKFYIFFLSKLGTASLTSTIWKKNREKISKIKITNDEYVRTDTTFGTDISSTSHCMILSTYKCHSKEKVILLCSYSMDMNWIVLDRCLTLL